MTERCILYARVSSAAQAEEDKTSLDTQLAACRKLAEEQGWTVVAEVRDVRSGATLDRPGLTEVRAGARAGELDLLVANSQDRISRMQTDTAILYTELDKAKVRIWTVQEGSFEQTPVGQMIRNNLAFAYEMDRARRAEATTRGKRGKVGSGKVLGIAPRAPYGYKFRYGTNSKGKQVKVGYDINEPEAAVVREIYARINSGELPRHIAEDLNRRGFRTTYADHPKYSWSGEWKSHSVRRLVQKEDYKGGKWAFAAHRSEAVPGNRYGAVVRDLSNAIWLGDEAVPSIVSGDTWEKANTVIQSRLARSTSGQKIDDVWLRGGIAVCGNCGGNMQLTRRKNGTPYLKCNRSSKEYQTCAKPSPFIHSAVVERETWKVIRAVLLDPTMLAARFRSTEQNELNHERVVEMRTRLEDLDRRRARLVASLEYLDGEDLKNTLQRRDKIISEADVLKAELAAIEEPAVDRESEFERVMRLAEWLGKEPGRVDTMDVEEKRAIAIELGVKVTVYPSTAPERLKIDIGAWTSEAGFFEDTDWSSVSSQPTEADRKFGLPVLQEAQRDGEAADLVRAMQGDPACRRTEQYLKWYCGLALFNTFGAAKLVGIS